MTAPPAKITKNLDALPIPDFSDYFRERDALLPDQAGVRIITAEDLRAVGRRRSIPAASAG